MAWRDAASTAAFEVITVVAGGPRGRYYVHRGQEGQQNKQRYYVHASSSRRPRAGFRRAVAAGVPHSCCHSWMSAAKRTVVRSGYSVIKPASNTATSRCPPSSHSQVSYTVPKRPVRLGSSSGPGSSSSSYGSEPSPRPLSVAPSRPLRTVSRSQPQASRHNSSGPASSSSSGVTATSQRSSANPRGHALAAVRAARLARLEQPDLPPQARASSNGAAAASQPCAASPRASSSSVARREHLLSRMQRLPAGSAAAGCDAFSPPRYVPSDGRAPGTAAAAGAASGAGSSTVLTQSEQIEIMDGRGKWQLASALLDLSLIHI